MRFIGGGGGQLSVVYSLFEFLQSIEIFLHLFNNLA